MIVYHDVAIIYVFNQNRQCPEQYQMYKSPRKQKEDRYQRLLHLIHTFKHTKQQLKLLHKIKADTVFEITLRHKRCQANKKYRFPFQQSSTHSEDDYIQELMETQQRDLVYDLNSQNLVSPKSIHQASIRVNSEKVMTEPVEKEKARSLSKKIKRVLLGRLEDDYTLSKNKFHHTYRTPTESTLTSQKHSARQLSTPRKVNGSKTCRMGSQKMKTEQSPSKKPVNHLQFQTLTLKKLASRLRTEKSNEKKSKIETFVSNELKRQAKQDYLIKCATSALKIKPKSILHKGYY